MDDSLLTLLTFAVAAFTLFFTIFAHFYDWLLKPKFRYRRLKSGRFVGARWQRDLFDNIVNNSLTENMLFSIAERYDPTKNWIEKDLSEYYSPYMIYQFYTNRRDMIEKYYLKREWSIRFEEEDTEKISKIINKIYYELYYILNYHILPDILNLRFKTPSIDNVEMATTKAKAQQREELIDMRDALTNILKRVAKLLKKVRVIERVDYEQSNSMSIMGREMLYALSDTITRGVSKLVSILRRGLRREKTHIYIRLESNLDCVRRDIGRLEWRRVDREISYLDDKILYYEGLNDASSNEYAGKLRKKRYDLEFIIPDLEHIDTLVADSWSKAHELRGKYRNRLKDRYFVKQPILRFNLRNLWHEENEDDED